MKKAKDDNPIITCPEGAYECGSINRGLRKNKNNDLNHITTDAQGNGYPIKPEQEHIPPHRPDK